MYSILIISLCIVFILIADFLWRKYGKNEQVVETVEFYPPKGYNSLEVGFLYKGYVNNRDIISLILYLAYKGYIKIEEITKRVLFFKKKDLRITLLKKYDGDNKYEKEFFNILFANGKRFYLDKTRLKNQYIGYELYKFRKKINSTDNRKTLYDMHNTRKIFWIDLMIVTILALIIIESIIKEDFILTILKMVTASFTLWAVALINQIKTKNNLIEKISNGFILSILIIPEIIGSFYFIIIENQIINPVTFIVEILSLLTLMIFEKAMPKRNKFAKEILGKIKGFKRFLETAEKEQLEQLVSENYEYFYNILPYTYALGVSKKWVKQFEMMKIENAFDEISFDLTLF